MKVAIQFDDLPNGNRNNARSIENMFAGGSDDSMALNKSRSFKIQARTFDVYNPTVPVREEVSKQNYARRYEQMSRMGFFFVSSSIERWHEQQRRGWECKNIVKENWRSRIGEKCSTSSKIFLQCHQKP